jgi:hypothetical protein
MKFIKAIVNFFKPTPVFSKWEIAYQENMAEIAKTYFPQTKDEIRAYELKLYFGIDDASST